MLNIMNKIKQCPNCKKWFSAVDILESPEVIPIGMHLDTKDPSFNLYFFNHADGKCKTTFTIEVDKFEPFITEPMPEQIQAGTEICENHCTKIEDLETCQQECHYAPYRRFLLSMIKSRKRNTVKV